MRQQTLTIAVLSAIALLSTACGKSEPKAADTKTAPATAAKAEIPAQQPKDWLVVDETDYIPVVDDFTEELSAARKAFVAKDWKTSASDLRAAADRLDKEATGTSRRDKVQVSAAAKSLRELAGSVEGGKATSAKVLDAAIAKAHRADLERDWLVEDATTWYPYVDEPNAHFQSAHDSFLSKDYKKAAEEIRKGTAFVRTEEGSAIAKAKLDLRTSERDLDRLAKNVEKGSVKDVKDLDNAFARADEALALSHQIKANEAWDKKELAKVEHELKAGTKHVEDAAAWTGAEAKSAVAATVRDTRTLAAKLADGSGYAVEEVGKGINDLGKTIADLGQKIQPAK